MEISNPINQYHLTEKYLGPYAKDGTVIEKYEGKKGIVLIVDNGKNISPRYIAFKTIKNKYDKTRISIFIKEVKKWFGVSGYSLILPALYIVKYNNRPLICTPYCEMDLRQLIINKKKFNEIETIILISQILKALIFSKNRGIESHQDLKPENIMIRDLSKKYFDFPSKDLNGFLKYQIKVADFGMANAYNESELPQGSYPYMAPEQYLPDKYESFKPDIFAIGVIAYEMLTGKHPSGLTIKEFINNISRNEKKAWSEKDKKLFEEDFPNISNEIIKIITEMLEPNPSKRPNGETALIKFLDILQNIDEKSAKQLVIMFEYYDKIAGFDEQGQKINSIRQLSDIKSLYNELIKSIIEEIKILKNEKKSPGEIIYLCDLCREVAWLLLKRNIAGDKDRAEYYAKLIFTLCDKEKSKLVYDDVFPDLSIVGFKIDRDYTHRRDFELYCEYIGYVIDILEKIIGRQKTKFFFLEKENYVKSAYFKHIATKYKSKDEYEATQYLDKCIELNPKEPLFYFFKGLWLYFYYLKVGTIYKKPKVPKEKLKQLIIQNFNIAIKLDPEWQEPRIKKPDL